MLHGGVAGRGHGHLAGEAVLLERIAGGAEQIAVGKLEHTVLHLLRGLAAEGAFRKLRLVADQGGKTEFKGGLDHLGGSDLLLCGVQSVQQKAQDLVPLFPAHGDGGGKLTEITPQGEIRHVLTKGVEILPQDGFLQGIKAVFGIQQKVGVGKQLGGAQVGGGKLSYPRGTDGDHTLFPRQHGEQLIIFSFGGLADNDALDFVLHQ